MVTLMARSEAYAGGISKSAGGDGERRESRRTGCTQCVLGGRSRIAGEEEARCWWWVVGMESGGEMILREVGRLEGHVDRVWALAWNPAPENCGGAPAILASCSGDTTARIWQPSPSGTTWHCSAVLEDAHNRTVRSCSWSPNGKLLATASFHSTAVVWDYTGNGFELASTLQEEVKEVKGVSWSASGSLLASCGRCLDKRDWSSKTVWIWLVQPGNECECVSVLQGDSTDVKMVQWHPSLDILVSVNYDNSIEVWAEGDEGDDWHCVQTLNEASSGHSSTVWAVSFNTTGNRMVTCSDDLTLKIWGTDAKGYDSWGHLCTLSGYHDRTIFSVHWSSEGVIASGAADNSICLFVENKDHSVDEAPYRLLLKKEKAHDMDVNSVKWSPKEPRLLASASDDGTIKLWELSLVP